MNRRRKRRGRKAAPSGGVLRHIEYKTVSFAGTGAKDVTEYLENGHTSEELVQLIDSDWVTMPDVTHPAIPNELRREDNEFIPA